MTNMETIKTTYPYEDPGVPQGANSDAVQAAAAVDDNLVTFAARVHRTGMAQGRDEDVYTAVQHGLLTWDDAMNRDD